eukprot:COSAG06_NODE_6155_length_3080_cov_113.120724_2_plen_46_part_00
MLAGLTGGGGGGGGAAAPAVRLPTLLTILDIKACPLSWLCLPHLI